MASELSPQYLVQQYQCRVERVLEEWLRPELHPSQLLTAMRYATLDGGKRMRPVLVYAAGTAFGIDPEKLDGPACAVELIHSYSLIHDDLPAMDDDDLRRGRPSCHKAFGDGIAVLAGDALQALAFEVLARDPHMTVDAATRLYMMQVLSTSAGAWGMVGGQALDLTASRAQMSLAELEDLHIHKTGALIRASVKLGALSQPGIDDGVLQDLDDYARCVGLAFQIRDDILDDITGTEAANSAHASEANTSRPSYTSLLGREQALQRARALQREAVMSLKRLDARADLLRWLSVYAVERAH